MDSGPQQFRIRTFEETELPNTSYIVYNQHFPGSPVTINPKSDNHLSWHPAQNHPTVFANIGIAVVEPDRHGPTTSTTPATQTHLQNGSIILYEKDNFFELLDAPGLAELYPEHTLTVVTLYRNDGSLNPTLTYYFDKDLRV